MKLKKPYKNTIYSDWITKKQSLEKQQYQITGWACNLAENGVAPKTLCELGGWSNPSTLHEYYTRVSDANDVNKDRARQVPDELNPPWEE